MNNKTTKPIRMSFLLILILVIMGTLIAALPTGAQGSVSLVFNPATPTVTIGDTFTMAVEIQAGAEAVDAGEIHLDFDPNILQINTATGNATVFPTTLVTMTFDNGLGSLDYAAGTFAQPYPTGTITLATIEFQAIATGTSAVTFERDTFPVSDVTNGGASVLASVVNGSVTVNPAGPTTGSITIVKDAIPDAAQDFSFTTTGTGLSNFSLDDDADGTLSNTQNFASLAPGTFTVAEEAVTGWAVTSIICTGNTTSQVTPGATNVSIDLVAGEDITCTFTNTDSEAPAITLLGDNPYVLTVGDSFTDPGATASDNVDGDLTSSIVVGGDIVDANTAGTYIITYDVSDAVGNAALQVTRTVTVNAAPATDCNPISTLPCTSVPVGVPFTLDWNADEGGMSDGVGVGTGFRMVDPPSARLAVDGTPFDATVPGYEPALLSVNTTSGTLTITSTKGIQYRDPSVSSNTNSQINALGAGFSVDPAHTTIIETVLVNPNLDAASGATNQAQQAGVWFGLNENNYAKVVIARSSTTANAARAQLLVENYGTSSTGSQPLEINTANNTITNVSSQIITLRMVINPTANTVTGFYKLGAGSFIQIVQFDNASMTSLALPTAFVAGVDHDADGGTAPVSYAGVFTTHRNAAATPPMNIAFDRFSIALEDTTPPVITLLGDTIVNVNLNDPYNDAGATALDDIDGDISGSIVVGGDTVNTAVAGTYVITYNVSDAAGNAATEMMRTVNVIDQSPTTGSITIIKDATPESTTSFAFASDIPSATTFNLVDDGTTANTAPYTNLTPATYNVSESVPSGWELLSIVCTGDTDNGSIVSVVSAAVMVDLDAGENIVCTFTNRDNESPVISLTGDATVNLTVGDTYTEQGATATDNVDSGLVVTISGDVVNTSIANTYVVTYNVSDAAGNAAAEVTRTVIVSEPPPTTGSITIVKDATPDGAQTFDYTGDLGTFALADTLTPIAGTPINVNFQSAAAPVPAGYIRDFGQPFGPRTDADQGSGLSYGWVVPGTSTPLDLSVGGSTPGNGRDRNLNSDQRLDTLIHMQADDIAGSFNGTQVEGAWEIALPVGVYEVTVAAGEPQAGTDPEIHRINVEGVNVVNDFVPSGANGSATRHAIQTATVAVTDGRMTIDATGDGFNTKIDYIDITPLTTSSLIFNNLSPDTYDVTEALPSGWTLTDIVCTGDTDTGTITTLATASVSIDLDAGENIVCTFSNAQDTTPPVITLNGDAIVNLSIGDTFTDPGVTATDDVDGDLTSSVIVGGDTVNTAAVGTYIITYDVSDAAGNAAVQVMRTVNVSDTGMPVITLIGDAIMDTPFGDTFTDPGATAFDTVDGDLTSSIVVGGDTVNTGALGTYTITYNVMDSSNNAAIEVMRTVNVVDLTPPVITLIGDVTIHIGLGVTFTDPGATADDNVDGDISGNIAVIGSVDTNTVGMYELTYTVSDSSNNAATPVIRQVFVDDTLAPTITLLGQATIDVALGSTFVDPGATAFDNIDGDITSNIVVGGDTVDTGTLGTYIITYNVMDSSNNPAVEVTRTVHVVDLTPPVITLLGGASIDVGLDTTFVDPGATANDNVDGDISGSIVVGGDTVNTGALGTYTITYNVSDAAGNAATPVTRTINVVDMTPPVITLLGSTSIDIGLGDPFVDPGATANDNVDGDISGSIVVSGTVDNNSVGSYTLTYNVSDAAGNAAAPVTRTINVNFVPATIDTTFTIAGGHTTHTMQMEVTLVDPGTNAIVLQQVVSTTGSAINGQFSLTGITPGSYDLYVKGANTLREVQAVVLVAGNNPVNIGSLRGGDANGDNNVGLDDFTILALSFNKSDGMAGYDGRADFNGDVTVSLADFNYIALNFNTSGASLPAQP